MGGQPSKNSFQSVQHVNVRPSPSAGKVNSPEEIASRPMPSYRPVQAPRDLTGSSLATTSIPGVPTIPTVVNDTTQYAMNDYCPYLQYPTTTYYLCIFGTEQQYVDLIQLCRQEQLFSTFIISPSALPITHRGNIDEIGKKSDLSHIALNTSIFPKYRSFDFISYPDLYTYLDVLNTSYPDHDTSKITSTSMEFITVRLPPPPTKSLPGFYHFDDTFLHTVPILPLCYTHDYPRAVQDIIEVKPIFNYHLDFLLQLPNSAYQIGSLVFLNPTSHSSVSLFYDFIHQTDRLSKSVLHVTDVNLHIILYGTAMDDSLLSSMDVLDLCYKVGFNEDKVHVHNFSEIKPPEDSKLIKAVGSLIATGDDESKHIYDLIYNELFNTFLKVSSERVQIVDSTTTSTITTTTTEDDQGESNIDESNINPSLIRLTPPSKWPFQFHLIHAAKFYSYLNSWHSSKARPALASHLSLTDKNLFLLEQMKLSTRQYEQFISSMLTPDGQYYVGTDDEYNNNDTTQIQYILQTPEPQPFHPMLAHLQHIYFPTMSNSISQPRLTPHAFNTKDTPTITHTYPSFIPKPKPQLSNTTSLVSKIPLSLAQINHIKLSLALLQFPQQYQFDAFIHIFEPQKQPFHNRGKQYDLLKREIQHDWTIKSHPRLQPILQSVQFGKYPLPQFYDIFPHELIPMDNFTNDPTLIYLTQNRFSTIQLFQPNIMIDENDNIITTTSSQQLPHNNVLDEIAIDYDNDQPDDVYTKIKSHFILKATNSITPDTITGNTLPTPFVEVQYHIRNDNVLNTQRRSEWPMNLQLHTIIDQTNCVSEGHIRSVESSARSASHNDGLHVPSLWFTPQQYLYGIQIFPYIFPMPYQDTVCNLPDPSSTIRYRNPDPIAQKEEDLKQFGKFIESQLLSVFSHRQQNSHETTPTSINNVAYPYFSHLFLDALSTPLYSYFICLNEHIFTPEPNDTDGPYELASYQQQLNIFQKVFSIDKNAISYQITKSELKQFIQKTCQEFLQQQFSFETFETNDTTLYSAPATATTIFGHESDNLEPPTQRYKLQYPPYPPSLLPLIDFNNATRESIGKQVYHIMSTRWLFDAVTVKEWPNVFKQAQYNAILTRLTTMVQQYGFDVKNDD